MTEQEARSALSAAVTDWLQRQWQGATVPLFDVVRDALRLEFRTSRDSSASVERLLNAVKAECAAENEVDHAETMEQERAAEDALVNASNERRAAFRDLQALDLEFREEGEGLPDRVQVRQRSGTHGDRFLLEWRGKVRDEELEPISRDAELAVYRAAERRYNTYPKLEALARELGGVLTLYHYAPGRCGSAEEGLPCRACALLSHLRELLGEEG